MGKIKQFPDCLTSFEKIQMYIAQSKKKKPKCLAYQVDHIPC